MRPCECNRIPPAGEPYSAGFCRRCYLYHNDKVYHDFWSMSGRTVSTSPPVVHNLPCRYEGRIVEACPRGDERFHVRDCEYFDALCTRGFSRVRCCLACDKYSVAPPTLPRPAGVVVGCFGWPDLAELQISLIRYHNGDVPILLCDDASPFGDRFADIAIRRGVTYIPNDIRLGHYAGDLSVFRHGIAWALERGLVHLAKVSQRMLVDRPGWLAEASAALAGSERKTLASGCIEGAVNLYVRTELMLLDVADWDRPQMRAQLIGNELRNPTELRINHAIEIVSNGKAEYPHLSSLRTSRCEGFVWHSTHGREAYDEIAKRFDIVLPPDFHTHGAVRGTGWSAWKRG